MARWQTTATYRGKGQKHLMATAVDCVTREFKKSEGRAIALDISEKTGKEVSFIERCEKGFHFSIRQYKTIATTDIDGNYTPSEVSDKWERPSEYIYSVVTCFPGQINNGDLEYFINNGYAQDLDFSHD